MIAMPAPGSRRLGLAHFAFLRGVVQGLDQSTLWNRYLRLEGEDTDLKTVKSTVRWIRETLALLALRQGKPGMARALRIDATAASAPAAEGKIPTLEEFIEQAGLDGLRESEQIAAFRERWGDGSKRERARARLIARQLAAIRTLEALSTAAPAAGDPVHAWMPRPLADNITRAGIGTIGDLAQRIAGNGPRWWSAIPAIGQIKADSICEWYAASAPQMLDDARRARQTGIAVVPMTRLHLPPHLDGSIGINRGKNVTFADNDRDAIQAWLSQYAGHTERTYRREAERLLLWAVVVQGKPVSSLTAHDLAAYEAWIADPQPADAWCAPRSHDRTAAGWRPFTGPLAPQSIVMAMKVIRGAFRHLCEAGYLADNPARPKNAGKPAESTSAPTSE